MNLFPLVASFFLSLYICNIIFILTAEKLFPEAHISTYFSGVLSTPCIISLLSLLTKPDHLLIIIQVKWFLLLPVMSNNCLGIKCEVLKPRIVVELILSWE